MDLSNIRLEYSPWFIGLCLLLGLLYAIFLYRNSRLSEYNAQWKVISLGIVRGLVVSVISFLLLGPIIRYFENRTEEPTVILAVDNSSSMIADAVTDSAEVADYISSVSSQLSQNFKLDTISFGSDVQRGFDSKFNSPSTNIDDALTYVKSRYEGIPLSGIVLASDGIYNQGRNPIYSLSGLQAPVYPIPFGDTTTKRDIKVEQVLNNKVAYLGDEFPVEVDISAEKINQNSLPVNLYRINNGERTKIEGKNVELGSSSSFGTVSFRASANEVGVMHLQLSTPAVDGEITSENNFKDIFIDVIDSRQKILLIGESPHPDMGAIYQSLISFDNYEVDRFIFPEKPSDLKEYDLVVLHQLPSREAPASPFLNSIKEEEIPVLWIVGEQSNLNIFNRNQDIVDIQQRGNQIDKVQAVYKKSFNYFKLDEEIIQEVPLYPPLDVPFGNYQVGSRVQVLMSQKVGNVNTDKPLIAFQDLDNIKSAVIAGEGIWRWRFFDYLENDSHARFDNFISQVAKYLSARKDLRRFIVQTESRIIDENEEVRFSADLYNAAYQAVVEPEVSLEISSEGRQYDYTFNPKNQSYSLNAGFFDPGTYEWTAETTFDGSRFTDRGQFIVRPVQREMLQLEADHDMLKYLAENSGGELWNINSISENIEKLKESPYSKAVQYTSERNKPMIGMIWIGGILAFLLLLEWFLRRLMGDY